MFKASLFSAFTISTLLLNAGAPVWDTKPASEWTDEDAKQVLRSSPWVKRAAVTVLYQPSEDQLRSGGSMGGGKGVGLDGLEITNLFRGSQHPNSIPRKATGLIVHWESASPLRRAEAKLALTDAPGWDGEYYAIAIFGVPIDVGRLDEPGQAGELKRRGLLKRDGMKDLRAAKVEITGSISGLATVLYLFPRTAPNLALEKRVQFAAQLGHLYVTQYFYPAEMQFHGQPEL